MDDMGTTLNELTDLATDKKAWSELAKSQQRMRWQMQKKMNMNMVDTSILRWRCLLMNVNIQGCTNDMRTALL